MCCLRYEQEAYEDLVKKVPKQGSFVETKDGFGTAVSVNVLRSTVKVRLDGENDELHTYKANELIAVPGGRPKDGEQPVSTFHYVPEPEEPEETEDPWLVEPQFNSVELAPETPAEPRKTGRRRSRRSRQGEAKVEVKAEGKGEGKTVVKREARPEAKPESGEAKEGAPARSRRGGRGRAKGTKVEVRAHSQETSQQQPKQKKEAPKPAAKEEAAGAKEGSARKSNRRRYYHGKPKASGGQPKANP